MRPALAAVLAASAFTLLVASPPRPAAADVLESALGQPLYEASHSVDVSVADGIATYKVRRVFANPGTVADEARLDIDLPYGAAATGLRIRAREQWFDGDLMEADAAAKLYHELTGRGRWKPKDPALLYWEWADKLVLQVFPVLPGATSTVEYTLTVPTRYANGHVFLSYPRLGKEAAPNLAVPVFTIQPGWGDATTMLKIDGARMAPGSPIVLAPPTTPAWLEAIPHDDNASYVESIVEIPDGAKAKATFAKAHLTLDIEHTYKSDLRVELYTPAGERVEVFDGSGGSANDVRGAFDVDLPKGTTGAGAWKLVVSDHVALDAGTLSAWSIQLGSGAGQVEANAEDTPLYIPDAPENASDGGVAMIELAPPAITELTARLGRVIASPAHAFGRLEVDAAPELRPLPVHAQVVFVLDASRSMGAAGLDAELAVVRAYLGHVPDAEVEVVLYRRTATRLFGGFIAAKELDARLAAAKASGALAPGNGSALDDGARVAAAAIAGRKGPRRIVLVSDQLLRGRWNDKDALAALSAAPADTIVHLVGTDVRGGDDPDLVRDDTDALAPIPLAHHGIFARLTGPDRAAKDLGKLVLGLVRPTAIDHFAIKGFDLTDGKYDETLPASLHEGTGLRLVVRAKDAPAKVELTGMIWGDPYRKVVSADPRFSKAAAAWVFSEDDHGDLSHDEMMTVAMMGRAVSPVTSYVAFEPGTRPSTVGLEHIGAAYGSGDGSGVGYGAGSARPRVAPDPMALVAAAAKACIAKHRPAPGWHVALTLESTYDEVVDVTVDDGAGQPIAPCLVEAVWAADLPADRYTEERERFPLDFH
ncbi:MAG TPA: proprotein convertase P-domain-containing protein [Kofleriaceae bacterium]|nr:proprotein convertase P-domain-containing protein [Kofleriaceae bacterium]